jgi:hypothetical protein
MQGDEEFGDFGNLGDFFLLLPGEGCRALPWLPTGLDADVVTAINSPSKVYCVAALPEWVVASGADTLAGATWGMGSTAST